MRAGAGRSPCWTCAETSLEGSFVLLRKCSKTIALASVVTHSIEYSFVCRLLNQISVVKFNVVLWVL